MTSSPIRLYTLRLISFMTLYALILVLGLTYKNEITSFGELPLLIVAMLTALPICGIFWTIFKLIVDTDDEYQRLLLVKQTLLGTALMLTILTCWQFLKVYGLINQGPEWHGVIWLAAWGLSAPIVRWRE
jgi:type IV secretory pathway VirB3-like protein